jgi:hypothetical protein
MIHAHENERGVYMKNLLAIIALATTITSVTASETRTYQVVTTYQGATFATVTGCDRGACKAEAQHILADGQDYILSGKASLYLQSKIKDAQAVNSELSESEALELLINASQEILN